MRTVGDISFERERLPLDVFEPNRGQVDGLPANPRKWTKAEVERLAQSIRETPELLELRPLIALCHGDARVVLGGNLRLEAARSLGLRVVTADVIVPGAPAEKLREIVIKDNGSFGEWDADLLAKEWGDVDLQGWGVPEWGSPADERDEYERKRREFDERMKAGEDLEGDEEYQSFCAKFELAKTTDDCYTPDIIYDALCAWLECEYGLDRAKFVRPFYPGGDFERYNYPDGCVVVDNPPFSIMARILKFYEDRGIPYFLFGPTLTLFSSSSSSCKIITGVGVTYANGARVNTSFYSGLPQDRHLAVKSSPSLYKAIKEANDANLKEMHKELPKCSYPLSVVTATMLVPYARLGIPFEMPKDECVFIRKLDAQTGSSIYGSGFLISERLRAEREKAEREKAEREKAEREKATVLGLSDREREIIKSLG